MLGNLLSFIPRVVKAWREETKGKSEDYIYGGIEALSRVHFILESQGLTNAELEVVALRKEVLTLQTEQVRLQQALALEKQQPKLMDYKGPDKLKAVAKVRQQAFVLTRMLAMLKRNAAAWRLMQMVLHDVVHLRRHDLTDIDRVEDPQLYYVLRDVRQIQSLLAEGALPQLEEYEHHLQILKLCDTQVNPVHESV
jgi:hypothetical protein